VSSDRLLPLFFAVTVLAAGALPAQQGSTAAGKTFKIACSFKDDALAAAALETAEAVWPFATKAYGKSLARPKEPLAIHIYGTLAELDAETAKLAGAKREFDPAVMDAATKTAHLCLLPCGSREALAAWGLQAAARRMIAREAPRLLASACIPCQAAQPLWLGRGSAVWVADQTLLKNGWITGWDKDPGCASFAASAMQLLKHGDFPTASHIAKDEWGTLRPPLKDACAALFYAFMAQPKTAPKLEPVLAKIRAMSAGPDVVSKSFDLVSSAFKFDAIDTEFKIWLRALTPVWEEPVCALDTAKPQWIQVAGMDMNAVAWTTKPVTKPSYSLIGELTILPAESQQLNVHLARADDGFVSVAFVAPGSVTIYRYLQKENDWKEIAAVEDASFRSGEKVSFEIQVDGHTVSVKVGGKDAIRAQIEDHALTGPWGLGAIAGSAGVWEQIKLKE
jgi:hypothetical protein